MANSGLIDSYGRVIPSAYKELLRKIKMTNSGLIDSYGEEFSSQNKIKMANFGLIDSYGGAIPSAYNELLRQINSGLIDSYGKHISSSENKIKMANFGLIDSYGGAIPSEYKELLRQIKMANAGLIDSDGEEIQCENKEWLHDLSTRGIGHVPSAPASQVFSVKIFPHRETCEVYGEILVIDEYDNPYQLYYRELGDPDLITLGHNSLPVYVPYEFCNTNWSRLSFKLKDIRDDTYIINTVINLDKFTESDYDKVKTVRIDGIAAYASVKYTKFFAAVLVDLKFTIVRNEESEKVHALDKSEVCGTIVARYGNTCGAKFPGIVLFEKLSDQPYAHDLTETPIPLLRDGVVVPAYSFLRLDVDLYDSQSCQAILKTKVDFLANFRMYYDQVFETTDFLITVNANWIHPDVLNIPSQCSKAILRREPYAANPLTEVFAFVIGHNDDDRVLEVCGEMRVQDANFKRHAVFTRDKSNPEILSSNRTSIPIGGPSECYSGPDGLTMFLDLWDVEGRVVIKDEFGWNFVSLEWPLSWYNRRICSISAGVNGYTAIFYQMFESGVQACVNVEFTSNILSDSMPRVYGTIFAKYSNEEYSTEYEKSYYRSVLFNISRENSIELKSSSNIPLLKSVVAVPLEDSLIVEVDLHVCSKDFGEESLIGECKFDFEDDVLASTGICGVDYSVNLSVAWSGFWRPKKKLNVSSCQKGELNVTGCQKIPLF